MRMKKSKGFTLIELLAVIVIVGILITLVSIGVTRYVKTSKEKVKVQAAEEIIAVAKAYMATNNVYAVDVKTLIDEGYLAKDATNPATGENDLMTNGQNFWIIRCKDDADLDTTITNCGFSNGKYYLSISTNLNEIIEKLDVEDEDNNTHYLNYQNRIITIINDEDEKKTIKVTSNDTDSTKKNTTSSKTDETDSTKKSTTSSKTDKTDSTKKSTTSSKINNTKENTISKTTTKVSTTTTKSSEPSDENGNLCENKFKSYCNVELKSSSSGTEVNKVKSYTIDDGKYNFKYKVTATNNYSSSWLSPKYCELKFSDSQFWYGSDGYNSTKTKIVDDQIDKSQFGSGFLTLKVDSTNKKIILVSKNNTCTLTLVSVTKAE